jgi:hypothetical protein
MLERILRVHAAINIVFSHTDQCQAQNKNVDSRGVTKGREAGQGFGAFLLYNCKIEHSTLRFKFIDLTMFSLFAKKGKNSCTLKNRL